MLWNRSLSRSDIAGPAYRLLAPQPKYFLCREYWQDVTFVGYRLHSTFLEKGVPRQATAVATPSAGGGGTLRGGPAAD